VAARSRFASPICEAIDKFLRLEFSHRGHWRVVEPYCHGVSTQGNEVLRAIQVRGTSNKGGLGIGKLWAIDEIHELRLLDEAFVPNDPNYNPNDSAMRQIHCRIDRTW
jgi:hypothetical protein